jgi:hypothetical protein
MKSRKLIRSKRSQKEFEASSFVLEIRRFLATKKFKLKSFASFQKLQFSKHQFLKFPFLKLNSGNHKTLITEYQKTYQFSNISYHLSVKNSKLNFVLFFTTI